MFGVPAAVGAHGGLVVVPHLPAVCAFQPSVVAAGQAEGYPAEHRHCARQDAAPEYLGSAYLVDLLQNCPLLAVEAAGEDVGEDIDVGKAGDARSVNLIVLDGEGGTLLS